MGTPKSFQACDILCRLYKKSSFIGKSIEISGFLGHAFNLECFSIDIPWDAANTPNDRNMWPFMESFGDDKFLLTMRILSWSTKNIDYYCQRLLLVLRVTLTLTLRLILIRTSTTAPPPPPTTTTTTATTTIITIPSRRGQNMTRETIIYDFLLVKNACIHIYIYMYVFFLLGTYITSRFVMLCVASRCAGPPESSSPESCREVTAVCCSSEDSWRNSRREVRRSWCTDFLYTSGWGVEVEASIPKCSGTVA